MTRYRVRLTVEAEADLLRLDDFLLEHDLSVAERALEAIKEAMRLLEQFPFSCRKAGGGLHGPRVREMLIPFGASGYVALFEIEDARTATILAIRRKSMSATSFIVICGPCTTASRTRRLVSPTRCVASEVATDLGRKNRSIVAK